MAGNCGWDRSRRSAILSDVDRVVNKIVRKPALALLSVSSCLRTRHSVSVGRSVDVFTGGVFYHGMHGNTLRATRKEARKKGEELHTSAILGHVLGACGIDLRIVPHHNPRFMRIHGETFRGEIAQPYFASFVLG